MKPKHLLLAFGLFHVASVVGVVAQPVITTQPQDQTNYVGTTATFTVVATGTAPASYQWQKYCTSFTDLLGRTNAILVLTNVQPADAGDYRVVVTGAFGATNSAVAHLYVAMPERLFISQPAPGLVRLSWEGNMVLQRLWPYSGSLTCPAWVRVAGSSPVTLPANPDSQSFRLVALPSAAELQATFSSALDECRANFDVSSCAACVTAYLLMAPIGTLPPSVEAEEAAAIGIGTSSSSCILSAQLSTLASIRHMWYGP